MAQDAQQQPLCSLVIHTIINMVLAMRIVQGDFPLRGSGICRGGLPFGKIKTGTFLGKIGGGELAL